MGSTAFVAGAGGRRAPFRPDIPRVWDEAALAEWATPLVYRRTAAHFGLSVDSPELQSWYRVFLYPGVAHCGGDDGLAPGDKDTGPLFNALVDWVERGVPPGQIVATRYAGATRAPTPRALRVEGAAVGTRPVCPYPQTALYKGSGDTNDGANFECGGNLELGLAADPLAKHKFENRTGIVGPPYGKR